MKKSKMFMECEKCKKECPIDEEKSNENWVVYKSNEPCECGGKFTFNTR